MEPEIGRVVRLPQDLAAELLPAAAREGFRALERLRSEWWTGENRFAGAGEALYTARIAVRLVGIGGLNRDRFGTDPGVGRIRRLYVLPALRRRGVARDLVGLALRDAAAHFHTVRVRTPDAAASAFYERLGFARIPDDATATHQLVLGARTDAAWRHGSKTGVTPMQIRYVRPEDSDRWLAMRRRLWPDHAVPELRREQHELLADPERQAAFVAASPAGDLVGFLEVALRDQAEGCTTQPVGYIEAWYVESAHRHAGVGRRLVEAAELWTLERGCTEIGSDALIENTVSHAAHRALGFAEVDRVVLFAKHLAEPEPAA